MTCRELGDALPVYLDGELPPDAVLEVERHVRECAACAGRLAAERSLRAALRDRSLRRVAPPGLEEKVRRSLRAASAGASARRAPRSAWLPIAASVLLTAVVTAGLARLAWAPSGPTLAAEVLSAHLRSLQADHLTDVPSSDRHTVKPWFDGKLTFSPVVPDLSAEGFPLEGGRLDVLGGRPVAALVYRRRLHVINVFVWPAGGEGPAPPPTVSEDGYHLIPWTGSGMAHWAASDLDPAELRRFVDLFQARER